MCKRGQTWADARMRACLPTRSTDELKGKSAKDAKLRDASGTTGGHKLEAWNMGDYQYRYERSFSSEVRDKKRNGGWGTGSSDTKRRYSRILRGATGTFTSR